MERAELYGALAAAMVRDMARFAAPPFDPPPDPAVPETGTLLRCWSYPVFAFIAARDLLWGFGVAEALDRQGNVTTYDAAVFRSYRLAIDGSEVARLQVEEELGNAARSLPEDVRAAVSNSDVQAVREALLHRWSDDAWGPEADPTDWQRRLATVANARRLMAFVTDSAKG